MATLPVSAAEAGSHLADAPKSGGGVLASGGLAYGRAALVRVRRPRPLLPALARVRRARQWRRHAPPCLAASLESGGRAHGDLLGVHGESGGYAHGVGGAEEESCSTNPPPRLLTRGWHPWQQGQAASAEAAIIQRLRPPADLSPVTKKRPRRSCDETKEGSQCSLVSSP
jgi:hypothetical protein